MANIAGVPPSGVEGEHLDLRIEWEQDRRSRRMRVTGRLTAANSRRLASGLIQLGNRSLELDLSEAEWNPSALSDVIELIDRVGVRHCLVHCAPDLALDLAARLEEEWGELNFGSDVVVEQAPAD